ncbi:MAG: type II toxin-antitoxin system PemK/MazF family toxin [Microcystis sp. M_OC_Ca_00000000_S217Cul]|nr:MAG: type II toxin-antitoxin system PemK/MazF family toxin [Microcystis sp. M_OC_Ca_00000000_S217Cul]
MTIFQGEIYWIDLGEPQGSEPAYLRPCVVVPNDALNQSQIGTVIVCPLTTNLRRVIIFAYGIVKCLSGKTFSAIWRNKLSV